MITLTFDERILRSYADGERIADGMRMSFRGRQNMSIRPDFFELNIYNLSGADFAILNKAKEITVKGPNGSSLCTGKIEEIYRHVDSGKEITTVFISDGLDFWGAMISLSVAKGNRTEGVIRRIVNGCTSPIGIASYLAREAVSLRGQAFYGRAADYVATLAQSVGARAFVVRNTLNIVEKGRYSMSVSINEADMPDGISEANGAYIVRLREPVAYPVGQMAKIGNRAAEYRIISQTFEADTQQGAWTTSLILIDEEKMSERDGNEWGGG